MKIIHKEQNSFEFIYVLEMEPQYRTLKTYFGNYHLKFPWTYFIVTVDKSSFYESFNFMGKFFWFVSKSQIQSIQEGSINIVTASGNIGENNSVCLTDDATNKINSNNPDVIVNNMIDLFFFTEFDYASASLFSTVVQYEDWENDETLILKAIVDRRYFTISDWIERIRRK